MLDRFDRWAIVYLKLLFTRGGSPERIGRGFASGVLASFFPLSALRFVAAVLAALFFRGNRAAALIAPAVCSLFEFASLTHLPRMIAHWFYPGRAAELDRWAEGLRSINLEWSWLRPLESFKVQYQAVMTADFAADFALLFGSTVTGTAFGVLAYPLIVIAMSYFYDAKIRAKLLLRIGAPPEKLKPFTLPPETAAHALGDAEIRRRYCGRTMTFLTASCVKLLRDGGETFPEMLGVIARARESVLLETYILRSDKFGTYFAEALKDAARRGVRTQLIVDGFGTWNLDEAFLTGMADAGVQVRVFHPLSGFWRGGMAYLQRRDHRKLLIADGCASLLGGLNIADEYAAIEDGGGGWRDTHVRVDGPEIAAELTDIFNEAWKKGVVVEGAKNPGESNAPAGGFRKYLEDSRTAARPLGFSCENVLVRPLSNRELLQRVRIKRVYLRAINASRRYILIENAFFIPDRDVLRALYRAAKRGVVIGVVVAMQSDVQVAAMAARALYDELLANGIRLFEYPASMIHSKVAVIDDRWSIVSSYNLNQRSLIHDLEVGALFCDAAFVTALREQILSHVKVCNEITQSVHRSRPWSIALLESFCYLFRYWL